MLLFSNFFSWSLTTASKRSQRGTFEVSDLSRTNFLTIYLVEMSRMEQHQLRQQTQPEEEQENG